MPKTSLPLEPYNEDIKSAAVFWWGTDEVYIEQVEVGDTEEKRRRAIVLFGREGVPALIGALQNFLIGHDSDCATHNEPAMPNGECDCSVSERKWQRALENKRDLDRLERASGNPNPIFAYTDGLPPPNPSK